MIRTARMLQTALQRQRGRLDKQRPPLRESLVEDLKRIHGRSPALFRIVALAIADVLNAAQEGDSMFAYDIALRGTDRLPHAPYWDDAPFDRSAATEAQLKAEELLANEAVLAVLQPEEAGMLMSIVLDGAQAETGLDVSRLAQTSHPAALIAAVAIMRCGLMQPDGFLAGLFESRHDAPATLEPADLSSAGQKADSNEEDAR